MWTSLSCDPLKGVEAFDFWLEAAFQRVEARPIDPVPDVGFRGMAASLPVAGLEIWRYRSSPVEVRRSSTRCRADGSDEINLTLMRSGRAVFDQNGQGVIAAGDIALFDMARPLQGRWEGHSEINLMIPREMARRVFGNLDRLAGLRIPGRSGAGRFLRAQMRLTDRLVDQLDSATAAAAAETLLDVAARAVATVRQGEDAPHGVRDRHPGRADSIGDYIDRHLDDPDLDVARIAAALGLSRSNLYRAFPAGDGGLARFILNRRLDLCRDALLSGALTGPLGDLAARWGFDDYGVFLRAFRRRFGTTPSALRGRGDSESG